MHQNHVYHQFRTSWKFFQARMGKDFRKAVTTGLKSRDSRYMYWNQTKYIFGSSRLKISVLYSIRFWARVNLLLIFHLLVCNTLVFICSLYPIQNVCFLKQYHQKSIVKYVWTEKDIRIYFLFRLLKLNFKLTQILT